MATGFSHTMCLPRGGAFQGHFVMQDVGNRHEDNVDVRVSHQLTPVPW